MMPEGEFKFVDAAVPTGSPNGAAAHDERAIATGTVLAATGPTTSYAEILTADTAPVEKATALYTHTRDTISGHLSTVRPWGEFFDRDFFCKPAGTGDAIQRITKNGSYFYPNYVIVSFVCSSYILLVNLAFSICAMMAFLTFFYVRNRVVAMANTEGSDGLVYFFSHGFTPSQVYVFLIIFGVVSFYLTGGSSVIFWLFLSSVGVSSIHAIFRRPAIEDSTFEFV